MSSRPYQSHTAGDQVAVTRRPLRGLGLSLSTIRELGHFLGSTRRWWLIPFASVLLLVAGLLVVIGIVEYAAPFVYTIF